MYSQPFVSSSSSTVDLGSGEMAQQLGALAAPVEDLRPGS